MRYLKKFLLPAALFAAITAWPAQPQQLTVDQAIDRIMQRENQEMTLLRQYSPTIETYVQDLRSDKASGVATATDHYFLGRASLGEGSVQEGQNPKSRKFWRHKGEKLGGLSGVFPRESVLDGFLQMVFVDPKGFDRQRYRLNYVRREFLGDVRCLAFDVAPVETKNRGQFLGRIWVEDQDYTIIRIEGTHDSQRAKGYRLHFDSWRVNVAPGIWAPSFIYSAESDVHDLMSSQVRFRAQTRLWGYNAKPASDEDRSQAESRIARGREAENNAVDRLESSSLLAPEGDVDKILATVVNNLEVSNNLDIQPEVECRVLLTSTLESFTIGHTVIVSRGLLDVLPDEASLAAVLAHELGHVLSAHQVADPWAFTGWNPYPSEGNFHHFDIPINPQEETAANQKALELLKNSPYKDKLATSARFLQLVAERSQTLPNLISPHLNSRAVLANQVPSETPQHVASHNAASRRGANKEEPVATLPFGSRIKLDPWTDQVTVLKAKPVALLEGSEQEPFQVGPYMPYLYRLSASGSSKQSKPSSVSKKSGEEQ
jgi:peptidase M48-like protein